ncbi:MAG TPA: acyltransferase domain-containing protein [Dysgonamonadaceae bacterium]|nr:acyltransferase domain-containing protein [Dysgonamonadaceae bacterium]
MKTEIIEIITKANFNKAFIQYIKNEFPADFTPLIEQPYQYEFPNNPLLDLSVKDRLFTLVYELIPLKEYFDSKNIPSQIFYDSIQDLNFRVTRYYDLHGEYGLSERDALWIRFMYKGEMFDLGSLSFQKFHFSYAEIERADYDYMPLSEEMKQRFLEGEPVINVHIATDADLRPEKIDESFDLAHNFFVTYFPEHKYTVFTCRTWMLYPPTQELLPPDSNITSFANRFEIIATNQNTKQALDRIYETSDMAEIEKMEKPSSLAKVAYKNLDKLGVAAGVIPRIEK